MLECRKRSINKTVSVLQYCIPRAVLELSLVGLGLDLVDFSAITLLVIGHLIRKIIREMTYDESTETLNHTIPCHTIPT